MFLTLWLCHGLVQLYQFSESTLFLCLVSKRLNHDDDCNHNRRMRRVTELMSLFTISMHEVVVSNRPFSFPITQEEHLLPLIFSRITLIPLYIRWDSTPALKTSMRDTRHCCQQVSRLLTLTRHLRLHLHLLA